jgi:hypothetical protein
LDILSKNNIALATPWTQDGKKDTSGTHDGAALRRLSAYSDIEPSLNATVYIYWERYKLEF